MAQPHIVYSKEMRENAIRQDKQMIAFGVREANGAGNFEMFRFSDWATGNRLGLFVLLVTRGKTPREAFDEVWPEEEPSPGTDP